MKLPYSMRPHIVNQKWGVYNPILYASFGFTRHNGEDDRIGTDRLVHAELPCVYYKSGFQPNGGGIYASYLSELQVFPDGQTCRVLIDYLHLKEILTTEGQQVELGQPVAIPDNTGMASTGEHLHTQYRRVIWNDNKTALINIDTNDANNSFDPEPFRDSTYAEDYYKISILQKLVAAYNALLKLISIKGRSTASKAGVNN